MFSKDGLWFSFVFKTMVVNVWLCSKQIHMSCSCKSNPSILWYLFR